MKKKTLLFGAGLMLTGLLFTTSCKDAVENALQVNCYKCTHPDTATYADIDEVCDVAGISSTSVYTAQGYTCTKK